MEKKLHISVSPHIRAKRTTQSIMLDLIIALLPAAIAGVVIFGLRALAVIGICVAASGISEAVFNIITKKEQTVGDLSAIVTGLILALNLPANIPFWQAVVGAVFAIIVVKCIFGGLGKNLVNPAATARVFMLVAFGSMANAAFPVDATAGATPLAQMAEGTVPELMDLFLGKHGGAIGETCAVALLIGGVYLLIRKIISWHLPVAFVATAFLFSFLVADFNVTTALAHVLSGGLLIGAFFMATDYVTSPSTALGKIIFGIGAGVITMLIRFWGVYPEGVSFAILLMNIVNPFICSLTARKLFGGAKK